MRLVTWLLPVRGLTLATLLLVSACVDADPVDLAAVGEPCGTFEDCLSSRCHEQRYCTEGCASADDCAAIEGCCVGDAADAGYCLMPSDCASICGPDAEPVGLPTTCACLPGFGPAPEGQRGCVPLLDPGAPCDASNSCSTGLCLRNALEERWCSHDCSTDADCDDITGASQVTASCCQDNGEGQRLCAINGSCP